MKTFLITYSIIQSITFLYWLYEMLTTTPMFRHERNRFLSNWLEGGNIALYILIFGSIVISIAVTKLYLWINFLEKVA